MGKKKRAKKEAEMLAQMALGNVFSLDPPSVHTSDASIEAAEAIKKRAPRLRQEVYETIVQYGPVTDEQIAY